MVRYLPGGVISVVLARLEIMQPRAGHPRYKLEQVAGLKYQDKMLHFLLLILKLGLRL